MLGICSRGAASTAFCCGTFLKNDRAKKWTRLLLVKGLVGEVKLNNDIPHDSKFLLDVKTPYINTNSAVCACIFFDSVASAESIFVTRL